LGERRGASALAQLSRFGMTTPVLKNGECGDRIMMGAQLLMMSRSLIACGRSAPEATQGVLGTLPRGASLPPVPVPAGGRAADALVAGKGAKAQKIGLKEQAKRWSSAYPMPRRREIAWELRSDDLGRAGETVPLQASRVSLSLVPSPSPARSGRQTRPLGHPKRQKVRLDGSRPGLRQKHPAKAFAWQLPAIASMQSGCHST
jgi:hypothetical protein